VNRDEIPPGTVYLLILKTVALIGGSMQHASEEVLQVEEGSQYPALQHMLIKGWVLAKWGTTAGDRRARCYRLTEVGRKQLSVEVSRFERITGAITRVIQTA
jgi:PadR family transcriptional regulator PadR